MPTRKVATAKKTVAKKSASAAPAKKTAAPAKGAVQTHEELGEKIAANIEAGAFDASIIRLEEAITTRVNAFMIEQAKKEEAAEKKKSSASGEKKVPAAPKKSATLKPVEGKEYRVSERLSKLAGATVEFRNPKPDAPEKAVVIMKSDVPGTPKGKRIVIPISALEEKPESKKPVRKKK